MRYLKLDVEKVLTDYNAQQLSNSRFGKKAGSEWFGQMELKSRKRLTPERNPSKQKEESSPSLGRILPRPEKTDRRP